MSYCNRRNSAAGFLALAILAIQGAAAQGDTNDDLPALWGLQLVAFGQDFPAYPSSANNNLTLLPIPVPVYRGKFLRFGESFEDLASGEVLKNGRFNLSIGVSAGFPEESNDLPLRVGMPDLDFLIEAGPELEIALRGNAQENRELKLSMQLRAAVSLDGFDPTSRGFIFNPEVEYFVRDWLGPENEIRFRVSPSWASSDYMDYFFGVGEPFATPTRAAFNASSGYLNTELLLGLNRKISERLEFRGSVRLWVNKGTANNRSPLFQRNYDTGIRLAVFWTAWESKRRAPVKN